MTTLRESPRSFHGTKRNGEPGASATGGPPVADAPGSPEIWSTELPTGANKASFGDPRNGWWGWIVLVAIAVTMVVCHGCHSGDHDDEPVIFWLKSRTR
jgi:hypothetical protein